MDIMSDKITFFSKIIYEKIDEESKKNHDVFTADRERRISELKTELEERRKRELSEISKEAEFKASELTARERTESRHQIMLLRESFIEKTIESLKQKFVSFTESPGYGAFLMELAAGATRHLEAGGYVLYMTDSDFGRYGGAVGSSVSARQDCGFELRAGLNKIIGGLVMEDRNRTFMIDNGFSSLIEDSRSYVGLRVTEILGQEVMEDWKPDTEG